MMKDETLKERKVNFYHEDFLKAVLPYSLQAFIDAAERGESIEECKKYSSAVVDSALSAIGEVFTECAR